MKELMELINSPIVWALLIGLIAYYTLKLFVMRGSKIYTEENYYHALHELDERLTDKFLEKVK
jgi:uncharacterized membrane protein (DUF373 family)